jgi:hypothetical protein
MEIMAIHSRKSQYISVWFLVTSFSGSLQCNFFHFSADNQIAYGFVTVAYLSRENKTEETDVLINWVGKDTKLTEKIAVFEDSVEVNSIFKVNMTHF